MQNAQDEIESELQQITTKLQDTCAKLEKLKEAAQQELLAAKEKIDAGRAIQKSIHKVFSGVPQKVKLNVGGKIFVTALETMLSEKPTFFSALFSEEFAQKPDQDGEYFIDRDNTYFHLILNHLRGVDIQPAIKAMSNEEYQMFKQELEFYAIASLLEQSKQSNTKIVWDSANTNTNITLSDKNRTATMANSTHSNIASFATETFSKGRHTWKVRINSLQSGNLWIALGVAQKHEIAPQSSGLYSNAYTCTSHGYKIQHDSGTSGSPVWNVNDVVTLVLDCDQGSLQVNTIFLSVPVHTPLTPIVMMSTQGTGVTIVE